MICSVTSAESFDASHRHTGATQRGPAIPGEVKVWDLRKGSAVHTFKDTGEEGDSYAVGEFGVLETQVANFAKHGAAIGVTVRIPTR